MVIGIIVTGLGNDENYCIPRALVSCQMLSTEASKFKIRHCIFLFSVLQNLYIFIFLAGIIHFSAKKASSEILNDWATGLNELMKLVNKTCHLINKEECINNVMSA